MFLQYILYVWLVFLWLFFSSDVKLSVSNNRTLSVSDIVSPGDETVRSSKLVASTVAVDRLFASMTELTCTLLDSSMDKTYLSNSGLITSGQCHFVLSSLTACKANVFCSANPLFFFILEIVVDCFSMFCIGDMY